MGYALERSPIPRCESITMPTYPHDSVRRICKRYNLKSSRSNRESLTRTTIGAMLPKKVGMGGLGNR